MRKYRSWDSKHKVMLSHEDLMCIPVTYKDMYESGKKYINMESTGLTLKDGVEIYEGDIVEWKYTKYPQHSTLYVDPVERCDGGFSLSNGTYCLCDEDIKIIKVIGTIYKNPKLLETK